MLHRTIAARIGLVVVLVSWAPGALATDDACGAIVAVELAERDEGAQGTRLRFTAELTAPETCRGATWDLVLVELLPNGQWKSVRIPRHVEVSEGVANDTVEHTLAPELKLLEFEGHVVECTPCR